MGPQKNVVRILSVHFTDEETEVLLGGMTYPDLLIHEWYHHDLNVGLITPLNLSLEISHFMKV